jgi:peptidoglycan/xylan/chitin deacetylase (PgdA/CDA1 family)
MPNAGLRIVFLVGSDDAATRLSIESVCRLQGIDPVAVLVDTARPGLKRRLKNLARNIRADGWKYAIVRLLEAARQFTDTAVRNAAISRSEVSQVLKEAFPERCFSLEDLGKKYGLAVHAADNLNGAHAVEALKQCNADLGVVLGTRILKSGTFRVPRRGCINLHKGKVPEYRGMPPGFWELYDGASEAGVTVHFVDEGLDTGDVVACSTIPVRHTDTPDTLRERLHQEGARVLASAVSMIRDGTAVPQPQSREAVKARTRPRRGHVDTLRRNLPHWKQQGELSSIARNVYILFAYYCGLYFVVRQWNRILGSRAAILLYHRVNDYSRDVLTVDTNTFAAQLLAISKRYRFTSTAALVDCVRAKKLAGKMRVAIHFDDCYQDILTNGAPILNRLQVPACAFISSGYIDTERDFPHDTAKYPFKYPLLRSADIRSWTALGLEVGAHTVNHVDLGKCAGSEAASEIVECKHALQELTRQPVGLFSFPFGALHNITASARTIVSKAGYDALFSAYGGFVEPESDPYDIPRMGVSGESAPVYCLLQLEGLAPGQIVSVTRRRLSLGLTWRTSARASS